MAHVTTILNVPRSLGESKHGKLSIGACKSMKNDNHHFNSPSNLHGNWTRQLLFGPYPCSASAI